MGPLSTNVSYRNKRVRIRWDRLKRMRERFTTFLLRELEREKCRCLDIPFPREWKIKRDVEKEDLCEIDEGKKRRSQLHLSWENVGVGFSFRALKSERRSQPVPATYCNGKIITEMLAIDGSLGPTPYSVADFAEITAFIGWFYQL